MCKITQTEAQVAVSVPSDDHLKQPMVTRRVSLDHKESNTNTRNKQSKSNKRLRVKFASDESTAIFTDTTYELTDTDKSALWYNDTELAEMEEAALYLIESNRDDFMEGEGEESMRGLEFYMDSDRPVASEESSQMMLEYLKYVHNDSDMEDSFDVEALAYSLNEEALKISDKQAMQDSAEAYMIYLETMDPETVNPFFKTNYIGQEC